ncbi:acyl-CoA dehydrogenase family protein [Pseudobacteriovorax antillogorgiicola]|uniref:Acyl-CoA dehydrogenase n=1 Tax=Pseudobacteriovorax antillogorgiicola TaxID=1513793 RepID=A0A1Y6BSL1_9BACT|nr:acyl-CoA dehydrogenase family protein [Pseudobacteriovorax antillogorgiicola]TCS53081.1 alkylation response protein AidB-like acyl-CoA dehydrogenase [Pseudobacteriovorax antillogorgiicola]SMF26132.1 Acyl-CoA dehydrogenase [Pseudobacteriovorax antillogorgiicola]
MLTPSPETKAICERVARFIEQNLYPLEEEFLSYNWNDKWWEKLQELRRKVQGDGLWGLCLPKEFGGKALDIYQFSYIAEQLGRSPLGHYIFGCQAPDLGNIELLHQWGSREQKQRFLDPLVKGELRSCFGMTERQTAGSNPTLLKTRAEKIDGGYRINGEKWFTTSADGAAFCIVMAVTDPEASPHQRASMFLVPTDQEGFHLVQNISVMGHRGTGYFSHGELSLKDCIVGDESLIGERGRGFLLAQDRLGPGRIHHCMRWLGICQRVFQMICERAMSREISSSKRLADSDVIKSWIAELKCDIHSARLMVLDAAYKLSQGHGAKDEISMIKFYVASVLARVLDKGVQVHGALGMTDETVISFYYREERASRIYDGPDEVHKLSIAKRVLHDHR